MSRPQGPHVKKLIASVMAKLAIPDNGGLPDAIAVLTDKNRIMTIAKQATADAFEYVDAVRHATDSTHADDESAAKAILDEIEKAKRERQTA